MRTAAVEVKMKKLAGFLLSLVVIGALWFSLKPTRYAPGVLVSVEPEQVALAKPLPAFEKDGWSVRPLAHFEVCGRLLHKKRYYSDLVAALAPFDFAVGWGPMSDQAVLDQLDISQGNRFFFWQYENTPPISKNEIVDHATNMHLIPSNAHVQNQLWWARAGDLIKLRGYLVEATQPGLPPWRSSLRREDSGKGACEIVWVESFEKL